MSTDISAAIATNRFGLGARPGELSGLGSASGWLKGQLRGGAPLLAAAGLKSSKEVLQGAAQLAADNRELGKDGKTALQNVALKLPAYYRPIYVADARAQVESAIATDRPFVERLVQFWTNHFAVSVDKVAVLGLAGTLER